jgi:hypothetical protein
MNFTAVIIAIAGCLALAGAGSSDGRARRSPPGGKVLARRMGRSEALCARLNAVLLNVALALAVVVAAMSTPEGARCVSLIIAHPEWLSVDAETLIAMDPGPADDVAAKDPDEQPRAVVLLPGIGQRPL